ncbi:hypothetical protein PoB_001936700 [Plakobranchus ocellatus]|uniref:Secreted protein n=1 Tax=Plakobranchus ocellatus TaxID=259542 RepID=A0AAV3ZEI0_9GAST|nr:hypothetical protein PoB_001936700 [Plakobranchus ocellatus]
MSPRLLLFTILHAKFTHTPKYTENDGCNSQLVTAYVRLGFGRVYDDHRKGNRRSRKRWRNCVAQPSKPRRLKCPSSRRLAFREQTIVSPRGTHENKRLGIDR